MSQSQVTVGNERCIDEHYLLVNIISPASPVRLNPSHTPRTPPPPRSHRRHARSGLGISDTRPGDRLHPCVHHPRVSISVLPHHRAGPRLRPPSHSPFRRASASTDRSRASSPDVPRVHTVKLGKSRQAQPPCRHPPDRVDCNLHQSRTSTRFVQSRRLGSSTALSLLLALVAPAARVHHPCAPSCSSLSHC